MSSECHMEVEVWVSIGGGSLGVESGGGSLECHSEMVRWLNSTFECFYHPNAIREEYLLSLFRSSSISMISYETAFVKANPA